VFKYLLFYRESLFGITVLRILHGARDITPDDMPPHEGSDPGIT
jgi:plasmid stabilization system protein ParE